MKETPDGAEIWIMYSPAADRQKQVLSF